MMIQDRFWVWQRTWKQFRNWSTSGCTISNFHMDIPQPISCGELVRDGGAVKMRTRGEVSS